MKRVIVTAGVLACFALGQTTEAEKREEAILDQNLRDFLSAEADVREAAESELFVDGLRRAVVARRLAKTIEMRRNDKQVAGEPGANGTTSLVALAGAPQLLSAALESGILTRTTDASVATVRLNASALAELFDARKPCYLVPKECTPTLAQRLKGFSFAVSYDQAQPEQAAVSGTVAGNGENAAAAPATATANLQHKREFRSFSAKYELRRRANFSDASIQKQWREAARALKGKSNALANAVNRSREAFASEPAFAEQRAAAIARMDEAAKGTSDESEKLRRLRRIYEQEILRMAEGMSEATIQRVAEVNTALADFRAQRNQILHDALYPTGLSFEYLYQRPANQQEYSSWRLAITKPFGSLTEEGEIATDPSGQFSMNFSGSFYHSPPVGLSAWRDVRAALQHDRKFKWRLSESRPAFSLAGYAQYQAEKGILEFDENEVTPIGGIPLPRAAKLLLDNKGTIVIAQAKLTIPLGDGGVKFPIALSWANRTELIKADEVKWQFGFTFDLDKLLTAGGSR